MRFLAGVSEISILVVSEIGLQVSWQMLSGWIRVPLKWLDPWHGKNDFVLICFQHTHDPMAH